MESIHPFRDRFHDQLGGVVDAQFPEDVLPMGHNGVEADVFPSCDLLGGESARDKFHDRYLGGRKGFLIHVCSLLGILIHDDVQDFPGIVLLFTAAASSADHNSSLSAVLSRIFWTPILFRSAIWFRFSWLVSTMMDFRDIPQQVGLEWWALGTQR